MNCKPCAHAAAAAASTAIALQPSTPQVVAAALPMCDRCKKNLWWWLLVVLIVGIMIGQNSDD